MIVLLQIYKKDGIIEAFLAENSQEVAILSEIRFFFQTLSGRVI
jgi:hypothetical protein